MTGLPKEWVHEWWVRLNSCRKAVQKHLADPIKNRAVASTIQSGCRKWVTEKSGAILPKNRAAIRGCPCTQSGSYSSVTILPPTEHTAQTPTNEGLTLVTGLGVSMAGTSDNICHLNISPTLTYLRTSDYYGSSRPSGDYPHRKYSSGAHHETLFAYTCIFSTTAGDTLTALVATVLHHDSPLGTGMALTTPTLHGRGNPSPEKVQKEKIITGVPIVSHRGNAW